MSKNKPRSEKFERGLKTRRGMLGDSYVDRSPAADAAGPRRHVRFRVAKGRREAEIGGMTTTTA